MIVTFLRSSSYGGHELCARSFFIKSVLGWKDDGNLAAHKGSIVHKVLEGLALVNLANKSGQNFIEDDEVYNKLDLKLCSPEHLTRLAYDYYSKLNSAFVWMPNDLKDCINWVNKALSYQNGAFDPRNLNIISPELHFDITIKEEWAKYSYVIKGEKVEGYLGLKGTIDNIIDAGPNIIEILDWKTGKYRKNWKTGKVKNLEDFEHDPQLLMYMYAIYNSLPNVEHVIFTIYFINAGGPFTIPFDKSYIKKAEDVIRLKFEEIKNDNIAPLTDDKNVCQYLCKFGPKGKRIEGKTICEHIDNEIQLYGIDYVTNNHMREGFDPTKYYAGGGKQDRSNG